MREGDEGDIMYIIEKGDVEVSTAQAGSVSMMMRG